jgi:hypothetical protein
MTEGAEHTAFRSERIGDARLRLFLSFSRIKVRHLLTDVDLARCVAGVAGAAGAAAFTKYAHPGESSFRATKAFLQARKLGQGGY